MSDDGRYGAGRLLAGRGPYGTNVGDRWLCADWMQEKLAEDPDCGPSYRAITEVFRNEDGTTEERIYVTELEELVESAERGAVLYVAAQAEQN